MKYSFLLLLLITGLSGCTTWPDHEGILKRIEAKISAGELSGARQLADSLKSISYENRTIFLRADSLAEIAERIGLDFSSTPEKTFDIIEKRSGPFAGEDQDRWERKGWLEGMLIDGRKMYFNRAASNLILLRRFHENRNEWNELNSKDDDLEFRKDHTQKVILGSAGKSEPAVPVKMKITYTLTVEPDAAPAGEVVRCWLPFPKKGHPRQDSINHLGASASGYILSPDSAEHSTVYMEAVAEKGKPVIFSISFSYRSHGQYFDPAGIIARPYNKTSALYKKYTAEQLPHINFSTRVKTLADSLTGNSGDPVEMVRNIYMWFKENIPWAGALEYSVMQDIPDYVCRNMRGDCGMQTFLFMSMLRYKGIPVRWQSGWMLPPGAENLHDWCEVYFEGTGWVPVDVSYVLQNTDDRKLREFYLSGIDAYRMIVNDDIAGQLYPPKEFLRSEPYDFQRGEVEWRGGNLYFDDWDYEIKIEYY